VGIEVTFRTMKAADRAACDTLLKVFIMTAATNFLSNCLGKYDTNESLQVSYPVTTCPVAIYPIAITQLPVTTYPVIPVMCFGQ